MKHLFLLVVCLITTSLFSQNRQINFDHGTFSELKTKALKENKLIFIDAYTTWCGPCKWMAANIFTNDTVADYYNKTFVNAKIDMEKGEGLEIAKQYSVRCYPNLLYIDGKGELVHRSAGGQDVKAFVHLGIDAQISEKQFSTFEKKFKNNERSASFMKSYISMISGTCLSTDEPIAAYFKTQSENDLSSKQNWEMIRDYSSDIDSREIKYLVKNKEVFTKVTSLDSLDNKISDTYLNKLMSIVYAKKLNDSLFEATKTKINKAGLKNSDELLTKGNMSYFERKGEWLKYGNMASVYFEKYGKEDYAQMNNVAYTLSQNTSDKKVLAKAEFWAKTTATKTNDYATMDTYTAVLLKLEKKKEALVAAEDAIKKAKAEGLEEADYKGTLEMLDAINKLK